MPNLILL